jgi:uncharacterized protein YdhG (YjbR/CyaY superfamily)
LEDTFDTKRTNCEISAYEGANGNLRLPLDKPIPYALISKIVKLRVKENLEIAEAKGKKR